MEKILKFLLVLVMVIGLMGCESSTNEEDNLENNESIVKHNVVINIECNENLLFSRYDVNVYIDNVLQKNVEHGGSTTIDIKLSEGEHMISFEKEDNSSVDGSAEFEVMGDLELTYILSCTSSQIEVEFAEDNQQIEDEEEEKIISNVNSSELLARDYDEVKSVLEDLGFTNIDTYSTKTKEQDKSNQVFKVNIKVDGLKQDIVKDQSYLKDSKIAIEYYIYEKPESVYYSTNDSNTVKLGNQGVYAYKSSMTYDVYWIIDFNEGFVYNFTEGNSDDSCLRFKIKSGTLNDSLKICYDKTGDGTPWYIHFNYENSPSKLIVNDHYNNRFEYLPNDLSKALSIMSKKRMMDA